MKRIRNMFFWIVIPAATSFLAGVWFTLKGIGYVGIINWLTIILVCIVDAFLKRGLETALDVACWLLEAFTGFLYIKVLAGFLGEFNLMTHLIVIIFFLIMLLLTICHTENIIAKEDIK